ncbi:MAG: septum site-determining protein MinC [Candidatus Azotimanducaceae bacterium]|jgi:septum site-determining protein MinC
MTDLCFRLKGSVLTTVVLELHHFSEVEFRHQLEQKIEQAPQLLQQSPIVFNLDKYVGDPADIDPAALVQLCRELGLQPLGFRSCPALNGAIRNSDLAVLPASSGRGTPLAEGESGTNSVGASRTAREREPDSDKQQAARVPSRLVTQPVRSGQQIYARDSDLIIMSHVSEGAEVLADGNIHVYGGLRGRALAGVQGDMTARIFCHSLEAELLSVAGNFVLSEDMPEQLWKKPALARLEDDMLCIETL